MKNSLLKIFNIFLLSAIFIVSPLYRYIPLTFAADACSMKSTAEDNSTLEFSNLDPIYFYRIYITSGDNTGDVNPDPEIATVTNKGDVFKYAFYSKLKNKEYSIQLLPYKNKTDATNASYIAPGGIVPEYDQSKTCGDAFTLNREDNDVTPEPTGVTCSLKSFTSDKKTVKTNENIKLTIQTQGCSEKSVLLSGSIKGCDSQTVVGNIEGDKPGGFSLTDNLTSPSVSFLQNGTWEINLYIKGEQSPIKGNTPLKISVTDENGETTTTCSAPPTSCAYCAKPLIYNQYYNACCENNECSLPKDLRDEWENFKNGKLVGTFPEQYALLQEKTKPYLQQATQQICTTGDSCTPGLGCVPEFTNPDPGVPPCIEGVDKDNKVISIDRSNFDVNGKIKDDEAVRKKVKELQSSITRCTKVFTSVGVFNTDPAGFVSSILGVLLSISGMLAVLLIIRSGYQMMTSQGNPEAIQEARDRITSAIIGLLFIIFSLVVLQVIGVDILKIPGFGG